MTRRTNAVLYVPVVCPNCGSKQTRCSSSPKAHANHRKQRKHRCDECGNRFKSIEATEQEALNLTTFDDG